MKPTTIFDTNEGNATVKEASPNVEHALCLIFKEGSLLRDDNKFVGFIEHNYVFGYYHNDSLVVRSIDNYREWMLAYIKSCFDDVKSDEKPDIREVWHEFYMPGVQITYGKLPREWTDQ